MSEKRIEALAHEVVGGCMCEPFDQLEHACASCVADAIAAAEERGRRRGDTERDELRALLRDCATAIRNSLHGADDGALFGMQARIDAAIAPRDSAPQPFTSEEARALWQAASSTPGSVASEPLESGLAKLLPMAEADGARRHYHGIGCDWVRGVPRDSGKEG